MTVVYNEFDPKAAAWLRHLIEEGVIAHGIVDERSIKDVDARDYRSFAQVHLFAGIGIWSSALRLAGWPDDRRVGTVSCPCQPFSAAGKGLGFGDPRHLWPDAFRLLCELRLNVVFGEQAPTAGAWIDLISSDLEGIGYAFGAPVIPAASFGGAHIRQRFYWVADTDNTEWWSDRAPRNFGDWPQVGRVQGAGYAGIGGADGRLEHPNSDQSAPLAGNPGEVLGLQEWQRPEQRAALSLRGGPNGWMGDTNGAGLPVGPWHPDERGALRFQGPALTSTGDVRGLDWLLCHDAKLRPVEAGTFPLAPSDTGRVGLLRGYGNALDRETAANFIGAYLDCAPAESLAA